MLVEDKLLRDNREGFDGNNTGGKIGIIILIILKIFIMILAGHLAWNCNKNTKGIGRIFVTILAVIFSAFYIFFYVIYHILLGNKC